MLRFGCEAFKGLFEVRVRPSGYLPDGRYCVLRLSSFRHVSVPTQSAEVLLDRVRVLDDEPDFVGVGPAPHVAVDVVPPESLRGPLETALGQGREDGLHLLIEPAVRSEPTTRISQ